MVFGERSFNSTLFNFLRIYRHAFSVFPGFMGMLYEITNAANISTYYEKQQKKLIAHAIRRENDHSSKMLPPTQT